jgi:Divergent InlB B-repeat domain
VIRAAHGGVKGARGAVAVILLAGVFGVAPATASAAAPLAWSNPVLVEHQAPFSSTNEVESMSCPSSTLCVAGSDGGKIMTSTDPTDGATPTGATWTIQGPEPSQSILGTSCPSTSLCVGVDDGGNTVTSTDPGVGPTAVWSVDPGVDGTNVMDAISCPSTSLCVAVDQDGKILTTTDPADGVAAHWAVKQAGASSDYIRGVSCESISLCVAVDDEGDALTSTDPGAGTSATWTVEDIDSGKRIDAVDCPSASLCVAVDHQGSTLTSTDPVPAASATWTPDDVDGKTGIVAISCTSALLCVAVDQQRQALTTADPADGAGATWSKETIETGGFLGFTMPASLSCVGSLCVVGDNFGRTITSSDLAGGATATWTKSTVVVGENRIGGISCASASLCVAVDSEGNTFTTSDAADGANATWAEKSDADAPGQDFNDVSCPSATLCVAVDNSGSVATSTDPARGATAAWALKAVDSASIDAVSCPSASLCVAVDDSGNALESTNPGAGASATWKVLPVDGTATLTGISCIASPELCVAVDNKGTVVTSTNPDQGASATWTPPLPADAGGALTGVSCIASPTTCVAVDSVGEVVSTDDPANGATATWSRASVDSTSLNSISCPSSSLCVAVDGGGDSVTSSNPSAPTPTWSVTTGIDAKNNILSVSCASAELCVAGDDSGHLQSAGGHLLHLTFAGDGLVTGSPGGLACTETCTGSYPSGKKVILGASPDPGWIFTGWSGGGCSGTGTCTVTMNADQAVTATFVATHSLTVAVAGSGTGKVTSSPAGISCPATCSGTYQWGKTVTLSAGPGAGSTFSGWSGGCSGTGKCTVTMSADRTVTATFGAEDSLMVAVGGSGSGRVRSSPAGISCPGTCSSKYATGTTVTLSASPSSGSTFAGWSGGGCAGTGTCAIAMSANENVAAMFKLVPPTLGHPNPPSCTVHPVGDRVAVKASKAHRHLKPRTLQLTVTCDQAAQVKLTGTLKSTTGKKGKKRKTFRIRAVTGQASSGVALKLTVQLPAAALKRGRHDSVSFTLSATNANGAGTATAAIRKLVLV